MADLRTNYKDDVLDTSVNDKRKYQMIQNSDGTVSFNDVTTYTQNGDSYGSKDVNETNEAVNALNNSLGQKVTKFSSDNYVPVDALAYDKTNKKLGLKVAGADTVIPFSKSIKKYDLGNSNFEFDSSRSATLTWSAKNIPDYKSLTVNNFFVGIIYGESIINARISVSLGNISYNNNTGILSLFIAGTVTESTAIWVNRYTLKAICIC